MIQVPAPAGTSVWLHQIRGPDVGGLALLDVEEVARAARYRRIADRDNYVAAHAMLRRLLSAATGDHAARLRLGSQPCPRCGGPHGRPILIDHPRVHFSLSHSRGLAAVAIASVPVGVDVEERAATPTVGGLLHPREQAALSGLSEDQAQDALVRCWVRKEAWGKATGVGLGGETLASYVGFDDASTTPPGWLVRALPCGARHLGAIAVAMQ